jgi:hypothetical protein
MDIDDEIQRIQAKMEERNQKKLLLELEEAKDTEIYQGLLIKKKLDKSLHCNKLLSQVSVLIEFALEKENNSTVIDACNTSIEKLREIIDFLEK